MALFVLTVILKLEVSKDNHLSFRSIVIRQKCRKLVNEQRVRELFFFLLGGKPVQMEEVELHVLKRQSQFKQLK